MSKDIVVFVEQRRGMLQKVGLELLGKARELADEIDGQVVAAVLGHHVQGAESLFGFGADRVLLADDPALEEYLNGPYARVLSDILGELRPEIVLIGGTDRGRDLAPRVAARLQTGLTADATELTIEAGTTNLLMTKPAGGGNLMTTITCKSHRPQMTTVRPGVLPVPAGDEGRTGTVEPWGVTLFDADNRVCIRDAVRSGEQGADITGADVRVMGADITGADVLVAAGRGLTTKAGFENARQLAEVLGGEIAGSRGAVDMGWLERDRQIGQTGKTVRPNVIISCGVSGAIQFVSGMEQAGYTIAINRNNTAAILDSADLGVVADANTLLPKLIAAIQNETE